MSLHNFFKLFLTLFSNLKIEIREKTVVTCLLVNFGSECIIRNNFYIEKAGLNLSRGENKQMCK